jgi:hypothetical protein
VQQKKNQVHYEKTENCLYLEIRKKTKNQKEEKQTKSRKPNKIQREQQGD